MNIILDDSDIQRGYVTKKELLKYYGHLIDYKITENSYIVEYMISTMTVGQPYLYESRRLPVL